MAFDTWRSLTDRGLPAEASELMVDLVTTVEAQARPAS
jgi:hypothetical protein